MSTLKINTTIIEELIDNAISVESIKIEMDHCNIIISTGDIPGEVDSRTNVLFQKFDEDGELVAESKGYDVRIKRPGISNKYVEIEFSIWDWCYLANDAVHVLDVNDITKFTVEEHEYTV